MYLLKSSQTPVGKTPPKVSKVTVSKKTSTSSAVSKTASTSASKTASTSASKTASGVSSDGAAAPKKKKKKKSEDSSKDVRSPAATGSIDGDPVNKVEFVQDFPMKAEKMRKSYVAVAREAFGRENPLTPDQAAALKEVLAEAKPILIVPSMSFSLLKPTSLTTEVRSTSEEKPVLEANSVGYLAKELTGSIISKVFDPIKEFQIEFDVWSGKSKGQPLAPAKRVAPSKKEVELAKLSNIDEESDDNKSSQDDNKSSQEDTTSNVSTAPSPSSVEESAPSVVSTSKTPNSVDSSATGSTESTSKTADSTISTLNIPSSTALITMDMRSTVQSTSLIARKTEELDLRQLKEMESLKSSAFVPSQSSEDEYFYRLIRKIDDVYVIPEDFYEKQPQVCLNCGFSKNANCSCQFSL